MSTWFTHKWIGNNLNAPQSHTYLPICIHFDPCEHLVYIFCMEVTGAWHLVPSTCLFCWHSEAKRPNLLGASFGYMTDTCHFTVIITIFCKAIKSRAPIVSSTTNNGVHISFCFNEPHGCHTGSSDAILSFIMAQFPASSWLTVFSAILDDTCSVHLTWFGSPVMKAHAMSWSGNTTPKV